MDTVKDTRSELEGELFLEVLKSAGQAKLAVTGTSMLPSIWPGDMLEVHRQGMEAILPGDVVLFMRNGGFAAHRVLEKMGELERTLLITRGDALRVPDRARHAGRTAGARDRHPAGRAPPRSASYPLGPSGLLVSRSLRILARVARRLSRH